MSKRNQITQALQHSEEAHMDKESRTSSGLQRGQSDLKPAKTQTSQASVKQAEQASRIKEFHKSFMLKWRNRVISLARGFCIRDESRRNLMDDQADLSKSINWLRAQKAEQVLWCKRENLAATNQILSTRLRQIILYSLNAEKQYYQQVLKDPSTQASLVHQYKLSKKSRTGQKTITSSSLSDLQKQIISLMLSMEESVALTDPRVIARIYPMAGGVVPVSCLRKLRKQWWVLVGSTPGERLIE